MAEDVNPKTLAVQFLHDLVEALICEKIYDSVALAKLKESYGIITKYEVDLAILLPKKGMNQPPLASFNLRTTSADANEIITKNLEYLTGSTSDWATLKVNLRAKDLLSGSEIEILDSIPDDKSRFYKMYDWISRRPEAINKLIHCLNKSNNQDIADGIRQAQLFILKRKTKRELTFLSQLDKRIDECENFDHTVQNDNKINEEKIKLSEEIVKSKEEKKLLEQTVEELLKKLTNCIKAEAKAKAKLELAKEIDQPRLKEELTRLQEYNQELHTQKTNLEKELETKAVKLKELENKLQETLDKLDKLRKNKLELEQHIVDMNSNFELDKKENYELSQNILANVRLQYISQIDELKKKIGSLEAERHDAESEQKLKTKESISSIAELDKEISILRKTIEKLGEDALRKQLTTQEPFVEHIHKADPKDVNATYERTDNVGADANEVIIIGDNMYKELQPSKFTKSLIIKSCKIDPATLTNSLHGCTELKSLKLIDVTFEGKFKGNIRLPSLTNVVIKLEGKDPNILPKHLFELIFWESLEKPDLAHFAELKSNVDIIYNEERVLYRNNQTGELFARNCILKTEGWCKMTKGKSSFTSLALKKCFTHTQSFPINLTELHICQCSNFSNILENVLKGLHGLKKFQ